MDLFIQLYIKTLYMTMNKTLYMAVNKLLPTIKSI